MSKADVLSGSHIPILLKIMLATKFDVVEFGMGYNSTPFLHWICLAQDRVLFSYENDKKWYKRNEEFRNEIHCIEFVEDWDNVNPYMFIDAVVLIDHRPAKRRRVDVLRFKDSAHYIVLHDSELADHPAYKYTPIYKHFKYKFEYKAVGKPYTMVLSNLKELSWLEN